MVRRFLLYSLAHQRPVRVLFAGETRYRNITVAALDETDFTYRTSGRKTPCAAAVDSVLSASYARGDDGDTLQYALRAAEEALEGEEKK